MSAPDEDPDAARKQEREKELRRRRAARPKLYQVHNRSAEAIVKNGISMLCHDFMDSELHLAGDVVPDEIRDHANNRGKSEKQLLHLFRMKRLQEFPKRKNGTSLCMAKNWFTRVFNDQMTLETSPAVDVAMAQGDVKHLTFGQLLFLRYKWLFSCESSADVYVAHRNLLNMIDERLFICVGEFFVQSLVREMLLLNSGRRVRKREEPSAASAASSPHDDDRNETLDARMSKLHAQASLSSRVLH